MKGSHRIEALSIDIGPAIDQSIEATVLAIGCGHEERSAPAAVAPFDFRATCNQSCNARQLTSKDGGMDHASTVLIQCTHVCASIQ
jgi:hypothetical protein